MMEYTRLYKESFDWDSGLKEKVQNEFNKIIPILKPFSREDFEPHLDTSQYVLYLWVSQEVVIAPNKQYGNLNRSIIIHPARNEQQDLGMIVEPGIITIAGTIYKLPYNLETYTTDFDPNNVKSAIENAYNLVLSIKPDEVNTVMEIVKDSFDDVDLTELGDFKFPQIPEPVFIGGEYVPSSLFPNFFRSGRYFDLTESEKEELKYNQIVEGRRIRYGERVLEEESIEKGKPGSTQWYIEIGEFLSNARIEAGMNKTMLSKKSGLDLSIPLVGIIERGYASPEGLEKNIRAYFTSIERYDLFEQFIEKFDLNEFLNANDDLV